MPTSFGDDEGNERRGRNLKGKRKKGENESKKVFKKECMRGKDLRVVGGGKTSFSEGREMYCFRSDL
jgi:hypothetical protein